MHYSSWFLFCGTRSLIAQAVFLTQSVAGDGLELLTFVSASTVLHAPHPSSALVSLDLTDPELHFFFCLGVGS